jgi:MFS family permease
MKNMARLEDANFSSGWNILIILSCLGLIVMFDETMILPAIPDFIHNFNISYSTSSWLLSAYIIAAAVMTPIGGKLSDIYGKKKILLIIMAVYAAGIMAGRFATNIEFMLAARVAQGVGMAMFPIAFGIIREVLPEDHYILPLYRKSRTVLPYNPRIFFHFLLVSDSLLSAC